MDTDLDLFFVVLARDSEHVHEKIDELEDYETPYKIICGKKINHPRVFYREPRGKWDAVNYTRNIIPDETDIVVFNDVDTTIKNFRHAVEELRDGADLIYTKVKVSEGPQVKFYRIIDPLRKRFHMFASGEFMLIRKEVFEEVLPVPPCLAEDSYILFKAMELGYKVEFCDDAWVETERTRTPEEEEKYKTRTTLGILQALEHSKPPFWIRILYESLPLMAPFFGIMGEDGRAWAKGILRAVKAHMREERTAKF